MKKIYKSILFLLLFLLSTSHAAQNLYFDGEDGQTNGWSVYDNTPDGATIDNVTDAQSNSQVISLTGDGANNGYILGNWSGREGAWAEESYKKLSFDVRFSSSYNIFVTLQTTKGARYLYYTYEAADRGLIYDTYIHHGLASNYNDGAWHTFSRDLEADLQEYEPDNSIITIDGLLLRGSGFADNVILSDGVVPQPDPVTKIMEDAEDGNTDGWSVYDNTPEGATIDNVTDAQSNSQVISLTGDGANNGYILGNWSGREGAWAEESYKKLSFDAKFSSSYNIFITIQTTKGARYLYYTYEAADRGLLYDTYIHHALTSNYSDGSWHTFSRDLEADLQEYEPDNSIITIDGLLIRGTGMVDNVLFTKDDVVEVDTRTKIFIIGDSTVHNTSEGEMGWGTSIESLVTTESVVYNQARSGASSKSYKELSDSHHDWPSTRSLIESSDLSHGAYLLIQFGHNDESLDEDLHTEPGRFNTFYTYLKTYVDEAREMGVIPVLITSVERMYKGVYTHGEYPQTARDLATDENVLLLDLQEKSFYEFDQYESTEAILDVFHYDDNTHFNPNGASIVSSWVKTLICDGDQTLCSLFK